MTFTEKLKTLTEGKNKAEISRKAGLSATAINDYLQRGYVPRADNALALAKALNVPLEWLVDDAQGMSGGIAPSREIPGLELVPDEQLMGQLALRYARHALHVLDQLEAYEKIDWAGVVKRLAALGDDEPIPDELVAPVRLGSSLQLHLYNIKKFDVPEAMFSLWGNAALRSKTPMELGPAAITGKVQHFIDQHPDFRSAHQLIMKRSANDLLGVKAVLNAKTPAERSAAAATYKANQAKKYPKK